MASGRALRVLESRHHADAEAVQVRHVLDCEDLVLVQATATIAPSLQSAPLLADFLSKSAAQVQPCKGMHTCAHHICARTEAACSRVRGLEDAGYRLLHGPTARARIGLHLITLSLSLISSTHDTLSSVQDYYCHTAFEFIYSSTEREQDGHAALGWFEVSHNLAKYCSEHVIYFNLE